MDSPTSLTPRDLGGVLLVSPWYKRSLGGVAAVADLLFGLLKNAGVPTFLVVTHETNELTPDPENPNVWYIEIPAHAFSKMTCRSIVSTIIRGAVAFWKIGRFVKANHIRTVVVIYPLQSAWLFRLLRLAFGTRIIVSCHGNDIRKFRALSPSGQWVLREVLKAADSIIVCANHLATEVQDLIPSRKLAITLIPNCVDVNYFTLPPPGFHRCENLPTIVHVSNFARKKRTTDIIEAFARADLPPNTRLLMVGTGRGFESTIQRAIELGLGQRVEFVGKQADVRPFLWQADLFILASDDEGAPLVLLEAMACGLPWVSTPWGVAATLPQGECGLVVPPRSPSVLAEAMAELVNDPKRCSEMGLRGRRRAETDFTVQRYLDAHLKLINQF